MKRESELKVKSDHNEGEGGDGIKEAPTARGRDEGGRKMVEGKVTGSKERRMSEEEVEGGEWMM